MGVALANPLFICHVKQTLILAYTKTERLFLYSILGFVPF